ncbi:MAG: response regulator transcription factor [Anaerolineales bacterium]|nr:response regulator transcription factor [Anaerolineales bacterium]
MRSVEILLVDDHPVVRQGLKALLDSEDNFRVVGEAGEGLEAIQAVEQLTPDVLVLDLMIPNLNGLEVTRQVNQRFTDTRVILLSMHSNEAYVVEAFKNGASGFVLKDSGAEELVRAINEVSEGRRFLSPPLSERALEIYLQEKTRSESLDPYDTLTGREREILHLAAEGHSNAQIAEKLVISPRTVETHRANLMRKLNLRSQSDLIRYAIKRGILPLDS